MNQCRQACSTNSRKSVSRIIRMGRPCANIFSALRCFELLEWPASRARSVSPTTKSVVFFAIPVATVHPIEAAKSAASRREVSNFKHSLNPLHLYQFSRERNLTLLDQQNLDFFVLLQAFDIRLRRIAPRLGGAF